MKRVFGFLMLMCLAAIPMFAVPQFGTPQRGWEVLRAEYGSGNQWVDVTERVRSLIQNDRLNFRVTNATLGVAPLPGRRKTLRLQLQNAAGRTQQNTYRENTLVRFNAFNRDARGSLQITRAVYGVGNRWADVTDRLNSQIRGNQLNLQVNNDSMGGDPARNREKTLRVDYTSGGRAQQVVINEGDMLQLNGGTDGDGQGRLQITRGVYGAGNRWADVTNRLNSQIRGNQLHMQVNNDTMGGDPAQNQRKALRVDYTFDGRAQQMVINEGDMLRLNSGTAGGGGGNSQSLQITRAVYGAGNRWADVTNRLNSQIRGNQLHMQVNNDTMGGDPAVDRAKTLRVDYTLDGRAQQMVINEGDMLRLNSGTAGGGWGNSQSLQITRAVYGAGNRWADVTSRLNSQIRGDQLNLRVTNDSMGGDPAQNQSKTLRVEYTFAGRANQVVINEGDTLRLNSGTAGGGWGNSQSLQITRAVYGAGNRWADVTARLNSQIRGDQLNLRVTNDSMGGDPAVDRAKTLRVDYTVDGRTDQVVVNEGDTLRLNSGTAGGGWGNSQSLQITRAVYGAGNRWADVTSRLNSQIRGDQLNLQVTNDSMGGDPAVDRAKTLRVDYTVDGRTDQVVVNEGDTLRLNSGTIQSSQSVRCESVGDMRKYCRADTRGGVRLSRQLSEAACNEGSTWGYTTRGIWVSNGCRADFDLSAGGQSTGSSIYTIIPSGTQLSVVTNEVIDSRTAREGERFSAQIDSDVVDSWGNVAIPRGSLAELAIRQATVDGGDLTLDVDSVTVGGTRYLVSTGDLTEKGGTGLGANKKTAVMVGGGAAIGTLIGAILGGGKGAAIGAAVGAGAGVGGVVLTKGKQVSVPAETILNFRLDQDLNLMAGR